MPSCCKCSSSSRPRQTRGRSLVDRPRRRKGFCVKRAYAQQPGQGFLHARVVVINGDTTGSLYHRLKIIVTGEIAIEVDLGRMATSDEICLMQTLHTKLLWIVPVSPTGHVTGLRLVRGRTL